MFWLADVILILEECEGVTGEFNADANGFIRETLGGEGAEWVIRARKD